MLLQKDLELGEIISCVLALSKELNITIVACLKDVYPIVERPIQWNLFKPVTVGPKSFGCTIEVASILKCWRHGSRKIYS